MNNSTGRTIYDLARERGHVRPGPRDLERVAERLRAEGYVLRRVRNRGKTVSVNLWFKEEPQAEEAP